jgi:hypothetical protein
VINNNEYEQSPTAKLVDTGNGQSLLVLEDWNIEDTLAGYTSDEVKSLIQMLQESLDIMNRYNRANEKLPLFENVSEDSYVQQETPDAL